MLKNGRFIIALSFVDFIVKSLFQCNFPISSFMLWLKEAISSLSGQLSKKLTRLGTFFSSFQDRGNYF